ncbi:MAG TPA: HNH endonuclease, partial [Candidatus Binatia bacterium]|nr:HNH endonuclease [Candidatus Binatia bacterium]
MALTRNQFNPVKAQKEIHTLIDNFFSLSSAAELRPKVLALIPAFHLLRQLGKSIISADMRVAAR